MKINKKEAGIGPFNKKLLYWTFVYSQLYWKDENKEKRGREWPIFKHIQQLFPLQQKVNWPKGRYKPTMPKEVWSE